MVTGIYMTHQGDELASVLLVVHKALVNIIRTRCMVQSRVKKSFSDKLNSKGSIGKRVDEHERGTENFK